MPFAISQVVTPSHSSFMMSQQSTYKKPFRSEHISTSKLKFTKQKVKQSNPFQLLTVIQNTNMNILPLLRQYEVKMLKSIGQARFYKIENRRHQIINQ